MKPRNLECWVRDFPHIFGRERKSEANPGYDAPVGPGQDSLLRDLCIALTDVERAAPRTVQSVEGKQKFGVLRVHLATGNPKAYALADAASCASGAVCEV